ncbi:MFS-type transporter SLC18B1 [Aphelenchoides bicaudatus]|nr:MFS-type transporter SLC18B1 [Aphelenchoides bicaudatus]
METFAGLGFTLGPFIGALLYDYGGFQLPFFFLGILLLVATVVSIFLVEGAEEEDDEEGTTGMIGMLKIPLIWIMIFAVVICAVSLSYFDPTLSDHLKSFNLSTTMVGFVFLLSGGVYTASAPLLGWFVDKFECSNALMVFGSSATIISMLFVGPSPLFGIDKNLIIISFSLALFGVAAAALYIPTFQNCLTAVKERGYEDNFSTYGCVSGIFQSAFAFGAFLGPTLGGLSVEKIGFPWTTSIIALINLIFVFTLTIFFSIRYWCCAKTNEDGSSSLSSNSPSRQKSNRLPQV